MLSMMSKYIADGYIVQNHKNSRLSVGCLLDPLRFTILYTLDPHNLALSSLPLGIYSHGAQQTVSQLQQCIYKLHPIKFIHSFCSQIIVN